MFVTFDNIQDFAQKDIPSLHPLSLDYKSYWQSETRKIIEGVWKDGVWCPPQLYHYLNFAVITMGEKKDRYKARPFNLDYVWDLAYYWIEARGLSGFKDDEEFSSNLLLKDNKLTEDEFKKKYPESDSDYADMYFKGQLKKFVPIRSYLRKKHTKDLGKPLYDNQAKNLLCLGPRGWGKSFWAANLAAHEFTTDGRREYKPNEKVTNVAEILLSAYSSTYVNDLIAKVQDILNNYPGGIEINGVYYPAPLSKNITGTWAMGKKAANFYQKKIGGKWQTKGTGSCFKPRVYKDNYAAAAGGRNTLKIGEEIGMWDNIIESHYMDENTQKLNNYKFGSTFYIGTGGDFEGAGILAVQKMMYDPDAYDCLVFEDTYENRGKIGLFYPATFTKLNYKNKNGLTNWDLALASEQQERDKKKASKSNDAYDNYVVFNPIYPSEIFLSKSGNKFPLKDLQATLAMVEADQKLRDAEYIGDLLINNEGKVEWKNNPKNRPIYDFPLRNGVSKYGSPVLYEQPIIDENGDIQWGRYIAGIDPYDHDEATSSESLGSVIVMDRLTNRIVAEYSSRPDTAKEFYEECRRLLIYYNAIALYENEKIGIFDYFESQGSLHLLAKQPKHIKDIIPNSKVERGYGIHMTIEIKRYGEGLYNTWLRESNNSELRNVHKIRCIPLLKETILYNQDGNFDRCSAMFCLMWLKEDMRQIEVKEVEKVKSILESDFFKNGLVRDRNGVYAIGKQGFF
jgi:hypothetical protein